jgi:ABC-type phosphate/phosphonate transport system substrate-binding protein
MTDRHPFLLPGWGRSALLAAVLGVPLAGPARADEPAAALEAVTMTVGFTNAVFPRMTRNDVEAAIKALSATAGRKRGYLVTTETRCIDGAADIHAALRDGAINLAIIDAWTLVSLPRDQVATPLFVATDHGRLGRRYLLLTRRNGGPDSLAGLRGKRILELRASNLSAARVWLLTLLLEKGGGLGESFFSEIEIVDKPSLAVLPVFFGKRAACLVDDLSFEVMKELNPQVGSQLQVVEMSEPLVGSVVCFSRSNWASPEFRTALIKALGELHQEPAGQQILALFRYDRLVPFQESHLLTMEQLHATHQRLQHAQSHQALSP